MHKKTWSSLCASQLLLGTGLALECGWYTQWHSFGENELPLSQQIPTANSFLVRGRTLPTSPSQCWDCLLWTYAGLVHAVSSEFICASVPSCLKMLFRQALSPVRCWGQRADTQPNQSSWPYLDSMLSGLKLFPASCTVEFTVCMLLQCLGQLLQNLRVPWQQV